MMRHANEEAENLRAMSQQRLDQAHETLKKALNRATEIIAEAHAEAVRFSRPWYEAPPARLIDPDAGAFGGVDPAREEPAAEAGPHFPEEPQEPVAGESPAPDASQE